MARFRINNIAELATQMRFTPHDTRIAQLDAAEELLFEIDPAKAYPQDFITFRITGYRPKTTGNGLLTGLALQHDLGMLIEHVSESLDMQPTELADPVLQIDDVCERFNVTSKTIQRWRRRGLPARRFVFPDGKRRVGFLVRSVERFFATHQDQVRRSGNFTQVDDAERQAILRSARRLATQCHCCRNEIARRIGRKLNRSPVTILHTIRKHDEEQPEQAIFRHAAQAITSADRNAILRGHQQGLSLATLAGRLCRSRAAVYRALVDQRARALAARKVRFIDDPLFHDDDAESIIESIINQEALTDSWVAPEQARAPRDLPPYLAELYRTPLLTPSRERGLFLKFNFRRYQFVTTRRRLDPQFARHRDLVLLERMVERIDQTRNQIVQANLRLVVSVARKHLRPGINLMELVSEGNLTLLRAVDSFDVSRGNRFSTYATLALMKGFARSVPQMLDRGRLRSADAGALADLPDTARTAAAAFVARDELRVLLAQLNSRERDVLTAHWGVGARTSASYDELGERYGLSRQRIRQIEQSALRKLRAAAELQ